MFGSHQLRQNVWESQALVHWHEFGAGLWVWRGMFREIIGKLCSVSGAVIIHFRSTDPQIRYSYLFRGNFSHLPLSYSLPGRRTAIFGRCRDCCGIETDPLHSESRNPSENAQSKGNLQQCRLKLQLVSFFIIFGLVALILWEAVRTELKFLWIPF